jgi:hypothetical protein
MKMLLGVPNFPGRRLPSIEAQTMAYIEWARVQNQRAPISMWLKWRGISVYLRYAKNYIVEGEVVGEVLVLASVDVPPSLQRRGWFWRYCQVCFALVEKGLVIESVVSVELAAALSRRPNARIFQKNSYFITKNAPGDWLDLDTL